MLSRKHLASLLFFTLFLTGGAFSQRLDSFSIQPNQFLEELESYMTASKQQTLEDLYKNFAESVKSGYFSQEEMEAIQTVANKMLGHRMVASGYFSNYLSALAVVKKDQEGIEQFKVWHEIMRGLLENIENRKIQPFKEFLIFSQAFFEHKALQYSKSGTSWIFATDHYELGFEEGQPVVRFEALSLIGKKKDSEILIRETAGTFYPLESKWTGQGGRVNWERLGVSHEIYCSLGAYEIDTRKNSYTVPDAQFHHPDLFPDGPVEGSFTDKVVVHNGTTEGSYPRFESKMKILKINNFGNRIKYQGGFRLHGNTIYGYGQGDEKANLVIYGEDGHPKYRGIAELLIIKKQELIVGEQVESVIYFGADSIYHPSVTLRLDIPKQELGLTRGKRGSDRNPFFDSFHKVNIYSDKISWYLETDSIVINEKKFNVGNGSPKVTVESVNFFDSRDYRRIQNVADINPLAVLAILAREEGTIRLDANKFARKLNPGGDVTRIQSLLYELVAQGFINYYHDRQLLEVKDKVFHYAAASQEKVDYDVLRLTSDTEGTNAFFDIGQREIKTGGIKVLELSAKQQVAARPTNSEIILKENRDIDFDGKLYTGYSTFLGKDFKFKYDRFHIEMDSIRYFDLFLKTGELDKRGDPIAYSIGSRIEHARGVLLIDAPGNKSGKEDIPMFPSFQSKAPSFVYYDGLQTQEGCYGRDTFHFRLDPFSFNALDDFNRAQLHFKGTLISADIFPDFEETLVLQEGDMSLGFTTTTPETGFPNYKGKGRFTGMLSLSNKGFLAKGNLNYLWASIDSEDIIYRPNRMSASAEMFGLEEDRSVDIQVPQVRGSDVRIDWRPHKDSMYIFSREKPFGLFKEDRHTLKGTLVLTPGGLKGKGLFDWDEGTMLSPLLSFGAFSASADTADVRIKAFETDNFAFDTKNVKARVDFDELTGWFKANHMEQTTTMPYNQYVTSMNEFTWDMRAQTVTFKSEEGQLGTFTSIHPDQDSLTFQGATAFYDMKNSELKLGGVPQIPTADALVVPDSNSVDIRPGGLMTTLENARIIANTSNRYHVINRARVDVKGRRLYTARGFYEYNLGDKKQEIEFVNIIGGPVGKGRRSERQVLTRATGEVAESDQFYMDWKTEFRGEIGLKADEKNLSFNGFARLDAPLLAKREWFSINTRADRNNLVINFEEPKNYQGEPLRTGLYLSKEMARVYPSVMAPLWFRKDRALMDARGAFRYDREEDTFIFGDSLRITGQARAGNYFRYSNQDASLLARGKFNIGSGLDNVSVVAAGQMKTAYGGLRLDNGALTKDDVSVDLMVGIEVFLPEKLIKIMVLDIKSTSFDASGIGYNDYGFYADALAEFISDEKMLNHTLAMMQSTRSLTMPEQFPKHTFFFSKLPMIWDGDYQSLVSSQAQLGVQSIDGEKIDKLLTGFVEFKMPSNEDDRWYMYLKSPSDYYYYFQYKQGILSLVSNNEKWNEVVVEMKDKERIIKLDSGKTIEIQPINHGTAENFVRRVRAAQEKQK